MGKSYIRKTSIKTAMNAYLNNVTHCDIINHQCNILHTHIHTHTHAHTPTHTHTDHLQVGFNQKI